MDLSKAFDTINHALLIAKLYAYGFSLSSLEIIYDYLSDRFQRTKVNTSFSSWSALLCGVPQGSVNGPKYFNIYLNDLFYLFIYTSVCNMADDTTPYACDMDLGNLIRNLEGDSALAIEWFEANYMIANGSKCHFLISGPKTLSEHKHITVDEEIIWESREEELLGLIIDKKLHFHNHVKTICKKASTKVTILCRLAYIMPFEKKRLLMSAFIESQFEKYPLIWMFSSKDLNDKINHIQERALRLVYLDYTSSFEELLEKDNSVTIHTRNLQSLAIEMFKVVKGIGPEIVKDLFQFDLNKTRSDRTFFRPNVKYVNTGLNTIRYFGTVLWDDMLTVELKAILTLEKFKKEIRKWIPKKCPCTLCREYVYGVGYVTTFE